MSEQCGPCIVLHIDADEIQGMVDLQRRLSRLPRLKKRDRYLLCETVRLLLRLQNACHNS